MSGERRPAWAHDSIAVRLTSPTIDREFTPETAFEGATGAGVRVAVIDSGIDADHPMLGDCVDTAGSIMFSVDDEGEIVASIGPHADAYGHGTAVAGIIHTLAPEATITSVRVLGENLSGKAAAFHAGLAWAVDEGFDIVNLSLGTTRNEWALSFHETCDRAYFGNTFVVTAANNVQRSSYPSLFASVASVACNTATDPLRFHANPNPPTEFLARGIDIEVPWVDGKTTTITGNSFAAPHIAGLAALIKSKHPEMRPFQLKAALWAASANVLESTPVEPAGRRTTSFVLASQAPAATQSEEETPSGYKLDGVGQPTRWGTVWDATASGSSEALSIHQLAPDSQDPASAATKLRLAVAKVQELGLRNIANVDTIVDRPWLGLVEKRRLGVLGEGLKLNERDTRQLAESLCEVIGAIHRIDIVHGALALSCVSLSPVSLSPGSASPGTLAGGDWLVHDMCLTTALNKPSPAAATALDPKFLGHLAPELLNGISASVSCDIYSIGYVLFSVLKGSLPYPDDVPIGKYLRERLSSPPPSIHSTNPEVDYALGTTIDACLAIDPAARPESIEDLTRLLNLPPAPQPAAAMAGVTPVDAKIRPGAESDPPVLGTLTDSQTRDGTLRQQRGRRWRRK